MKLKNIVSLCIVGFLQFCIAHEASSAIVTFDYTGRAFVGENALVNGLYFDTRDTANNSFFQFLPFELVFTLDTTKGVPFSSAGFTGLGTQSFSTNPVTAVLTIGGQLYNGFSSFPTFGGSAAIFQNGAVTGTRQTENGFDNTTEVDLIMNVRSSTGGIPLSLTDAYVLSLNDGGPFTATGDFIAFCQGDDCPVHQPNVLNGYSVDLTLTPSSVSVTVAGGDNSTPVPSALPLFASGLGVLALLGGRRNRKKKIVDTTN